MRKGTRQHGRIQVFIFYTVIMSLEVLKEKVLIFVSNPRFSFMGVKLSAFKLHATTRHTFLVTRHKFSRHTRSRTGPLKAMFILVLFEFFSMSPQPW
jgi:hypothetical protein